jgi:hypothetical protein
LKIPESLPISQPSILDVSIGKRVQENVEDFILEFAEVAVPKSVEEIQRFGITA